MKTMQEFVDWAETWKTDFVIMPEEQRRHTGNYSFILTITYTKTAFLGLFT